MVTLQSEGAETLSGFGPSMDFLFRLPASRFSASYDGSFATCMTSVPEGMSGETTLSNMPVAV